MKIQVDITENYFQGDHGGDVAGFTVTCSKCGHYVEVFGQGDYSASRGAIKLRDECPKYEDNCYVIPEQYT